MKKIVSRRVLFILSLLASLVFGFVIFELQMLPLKFFIPLMIIIVLMMVLFYRGEKDKYHQHHIRVALLKLLHIMLSVALVLVSLYAMKGSNLLAAITGGGDQIVEMDVIVLKTSPYETLNDLKEASIGANFSVDSVNLNKAEAIIEDEIGDVEIEGYSSNELLVSSLMNRNIESAIVKAVDLETFDNIKEGFNDKIKIIKKIEIKIPGVSAKNAKVTQEPFNILISGTDKEGPIGTFALSDVNMLATVNPITKQILLTSIPRDYYVDIIGMDGVNGKDKLTHSAKGGINCTIRTVENFMGIECNYYAKFNFTSFMNVIDALGGISIDVPKYDVIGNDEGIFTTKKGHYTIKPGVNEFNAKQALCFVRERKAFVLGDTIRGENQMLMMKAIIKKCCSPAILTKLDGVFSSIADSFETNMSASEVKSLINMQIDDMSSWDIQTYHLDGDASQRTTVLATVGNVTAVNPLGVFITEPKQESLDQCHTYIQSIKNNEIVKIEKTKKKSNNGEY